MTGENEDVIDTDDKQPARIKVADEDETPQHNKRKGKAGSKKPKRWPLIILVIVILLMIIIPIAATLQAPVVNVVGMEVRSSGTGTGRTYKTFATVQVDNPNIAGVTVLHIEGKFYVNGEYGGDFSRDESVDIVAHGSTTFDVEVQVLSPFIVKWNANNQIEVIGTVTVKGALTSWDVPFDETRDVHVP